MKIGIVGNGFVGGATALFATDFVSVVVYDKDPQKRNPSYTTVDDLVDCDFVCPCFCGFIFY